MKAFDSHEHIAIGFSGGKDSLALLLFMRPWWGKSTVFWGNTGDMPSDVVALAARVKALVPHFIEVKSDAEGHRRRFGWPSDVVPTSHTTLGQTILGEHDFTVQHRLFCCHTVIMQPVTQAMLDAGCTAIVRGRRSAEEDRTQNAGVSDGVEVIYPLWDWTDDDVFQYLAGCGIPLPSAYQYTNHSVDCLHCTAWWQHRYVDYLRAEYPNIAAEVLRRVGLIKHAVLDEMSHLEEVLP